MTRETHTAATSDAAKRNAERSLSHPGTWLPGDQVIDHDCILTRDSSGKWGCPEHGESLGDWWVGNRVDTGEWRITHLVPRESESDQPPTLPDTSGWVKRSPGDVIEAGTPVMWSSDFGLSYRTAYMEFTVDDGEPIWTPPPAEPEPWKLIPVGRDNAQVLRINNEITIECWREEEKIYRPGLHGASGITLWRADEITSVEPVTVCGPDQRDTLDAKVSCSRPHVEDGMVPVERETLAYIVRDSRANNAAWVVEELRSTLAGDPR